MKLAVWLGWGLRLELGLIVVAFLASVSLKTRVEGLSQEALGLPQRSCFLTIWTSWLVC